MKLRFENCIQPNESRAEFTLKRVVDERFAYGCDNILNVEAHLVWSSAHTHLKTSNPEQIPTTNIS